MRRFLSSILSLALVASVVIPATSASARDRHDDRWERQRHYQDNRRDDRCHDNRGRNNNAAAVGIIGLAAGAIIGSAIVNNNNNYNNNYRAPVRSNYGRPGSREWVQFCSNRHRSFNPSSGTYRGPDGLNHYCVM